jgi:hypothetical protein
MGPWRPLWTFYPLPTRGAFDDSPGLVRLGAFWLGLCSHASSDLRGVTLQSVDTYQKTLEHHSRFLTVTRNGDSNRIEDMTTLLRKTLVLVGNRFYNLYDEMRDTDFPKPARVLLSTIF